MGIAAAAAPGAPLVQEDKPGNILLDGGAYASSSTAVIANAATFACGPYEVPNARIDAAVAKEGFCHLESVRQTKDGRQLPVDLTLSVLRDPQGNAIGRSAIRE